MHVKASSNVLRDKQVAVQICVHNVMVTNDASESGGLVHPSGVPQVSRLRTQ